MEHDLKTDPDAYNDITDMEARKSFEIRKDDRGFKVGDFLRLKKTKYTGEEMKRGKPLEYTGEQCRVAVNYILRGPCYGLKDGYVIMAVS